MIERVQAEIISTSAYTGVHALHRSVLEALRKVPRHLFVGPDVQESAYLNRPLPIGCGQTISEPFIVALMTELAQVDASSRVLEIGTGSGYQAAVLSVIVHEVYSIERIETLAMLAHQRLHDQGFDNVYSKIGDGYDGWSEYAPYDAILITAATDQPPNNLLQQLKPGGRMVVPLERACGGQELTVITRALNGRFTRHSTLNVIFVPLLEGENSDVQYF
jgi:protein-L-isoaspartate(D-aspartate) O-methyltransferase